jgi:hypothetical protein
MDSCVACFGTDEKAAKQAALDEFKTIAKPQEVWHNQRIIVWQPCTTPLEWTTYTIAYKMALEKIALDNGGQKV